MKKLDVGFYNLEKEKQHTSDSEYLREFVRAERCWNIYFHGFMDELCDIAYVKQTTVIEPGIYEVEVYGIPAILYLWKYTDEHPRDLKGLICRADDVEARADAQEKFDDNRMFI